MRTPDRQFWRAIRRRAGGVPCGFLGRSRCRTRPLRRPPGARRRARRRAHPDQSTWVRRLFGQHADRQLWRSGRPVVALAVVLLDHRSLFLDPPFDGRSREALGPTPYTSEDRYPTKGIGETARAREPAVEGVKVWKNDVASRATPRSEQPRATEHDDYKQHKGCARDARQRPGSSGDRKQDRHGGSSPEHFGPT
jgi:hypothetical protein